MHWELERISHPAAASRAQVLLDAIRKMAGPNLQLCTRSELCTEVQVVLVDTWTNQNSNLLV
jgi:hypothetical protein